MGIFNFFGTKKSETTMTFEELASKYIQAYNWYKIQMQQTNNLTSVQKDKVFDAIKKELYKTFNFKKSYSNDTFDIHCTIQDICYLIDVSDEGGYYKIWIKPARSEFIVNNLKFKINDFMVKTRNYKAEQLNKSDKISINLDLRALISVNYGNYFIGLECQNEDDIAGTISQGDITLKVMIRKVYI